ncbi:MAG: family 20 glycosylhydrolase, partial [Prevotella sp.]|nr:family 20 glycosylhydrolase [Prevotella sp.]
MKRRSATSICLLLSLLFLAAVAFVPVPLRAQQKPFTIPEIKQWKSGTGEFVLTEESKIFVNDTRLGSAAKMLNTGLLFCQERCADQATALNILSSGKGRAGDIVLNYKKQSKKDGPEAYAIRIADKIVIEAEERGALHAAATLMQMVRNDHGRTVWPQGTIADRPDYPMRGLMLDCGRKYIPMSYLRDLLPLMAYYKMNTLQIHLNDNG